MSIRILSFSVALAATAFAAPAHALHFGSGHAKGQCFANSSGAAAIQPCVANAGNQQISMRYIANENVFFGPLMIGGQCLQANGQGQKLSFGACNNSPAQQWKLTGSNRMLNNGQGFCADLPGGTTAAGAGIIAWPCSGASNQKWHGDIKVIAVPNMASTTTGAPLAVAKTTNAAKGVKANDVVSSTGSVVAAGAGNIVAGGAGNIVAGGAGNIVAGGAGN
jgi:hypothetical protein